MAGKVVDALKALKVPRVSVVHVEAMHGDGVPDKQFQQEEGIDAGCCYTKMVKIELICNDERVEQVKQIILKAAKTGHKGDGMVAVSPLDEAVSIRTGENAIEG